MLKLLIKYLKLRLGPDAWVLEERERLRARGLPPELLEPLAGVARVLASTLPLSPQVVYEYILGAVETRYFVLVEKRRLGIL